MGYSEDFIPDGMNAFERNVKRIGEFYYQYFLHCS